MGLSSVCQSAASLARVQRSFLNLSFLILWTGVLFCCIMATGLEMLGWQTEPRFAFSFCLLNLLGFALILGFLDCACFPKKVTCLTCKARACGVLCGFKLALSLSLHMAISTQPPPLRDQIRVKKPTKPLARTNEQENSGSHPSEVPLPFTLMHADDAAVSLRLQGNARITSRVNRKKW